MKLSVYVETSVISYLTARPSRDVIVLAHQEITRQWWQAGRDKVRVVISDFVEQEAAAGDTVAARERLAIISELERIDIDHRIDTLAKELLAKGALPAQAVYDALHLAVCAVNQIDILVTWNCKHIANVTMYSLMESVCTSLGYKAPRICTPIELWGM
jgi:predicted nucleic acid-binding protein